MRDIIIDGIATLAGLALALGVIFGVGYAGYLSYEFFAPRYTAVDSKVFKESVQYNEGMVRDLSELERQYKQADDNGKAALRPIIRHRFEVYDKQRLTENYPDLAAFYDSIQ